ncbi:MAG: cupin domain-containing protein [Chloroflexota bacterium]|nr:cupin domain-containing protein [Chloroflexota bacterium]
MAANEGVRIVRADQRSTATPQSGGMKREAGIAPDTTGSQDLWMGLATTPGGMVSSWHHHGDCETGIYMLQGRARFRWGKGGTQTAEVAPGDFIAVAPGAIHMEETLGYGDAVFVVARACSEVTVVNVDGPEPE